MLKTKLQQRTGFFLPPRGSVGPEIPSSGWERRGLEERSLTGCLLPPTPPPALLWLAVTRGPERFLITTQEPNYLHAPGRGDSTAPQGPNPGLSPPHPSAQPVVFASSFAYIYI